MMLGFLAYRTTSIADATLIPALTPALILVLARRLFGEQRSRRQIVLAVAAFAGVAVVVLGAGKNSGQSLKGDLFSAGNLFVWTAYLVLAKQIRNRNVHSWSLIATFFTIAAVVVTPYCLIASNDLLASKPRDYVLYAVMIVGPGTLGHGLMTWANKYVDLSISSVLSLANPVLSMVWAWMIYGERLGPEQLVGVCVVIGALALITLDPSPAGAVSIEVTDGAVA